MGNCACNNYKNNLTNQKSIIINELGSISPINHSNNLTLINNKLRINNNFLYNKSTDNFSKELSFEMKMLNEINFVRSNPKDYALKLKTIIDDIIIENNIEYLNGINFGFNKKILLKNGSKIFYDTVDFLNNIQPLSQLNYCDDIKVIFDDTIFEKDEFKFSKENIEYLLINKRLEILKKYNQCAFNIDNFPNPILSIVFQITDEIFNQERRNIILNKNFKIFACNISKDKENIFISISSFA
jgi:hypothetical protein